MTNQIVTPRSASRVAGLVRVAPDPSVADLVEQHWIVTWTAGQAPIRREVLPDPCVNLSVEPAGRLLYGVGSVRSIRELEGHGMVIGTKFRPGGFSGFLPGPVSELNGRVLSLPEAFGERGERFDAALAAAPDIPAIIAEVTRFLRAQRPPPDPDRRLAIEIASAMRVASPGTQITELAAQFAVSPRTLQRLFARHVGATPKQVLQRFRRQRAVDRLSEETGASLAEIAAELGYSDQSHLARDFRTTFGRGPSALATLP
ncbi:MAG: AraC family transcriptional regulator [Actinobacteria bacterium]|nr:AraC family transcriptional regulator [Actinomycetota bacterium]